MLWVLIRIALTYVVGTQNRLGTYVVYSLESPRRADSNEYPQHMFLWRNKENYPLIITKYPSHLFCWMHNNDLVLHDF